MKKAQFSIFAAVLVSTAVLMVCQPGEGMDAKEYRTSFRIEKEGAVTWLYDGQQRVLAYYPEFVRFGSCRLVPGGYEMFPHPSMIWGPYGWFFPYWGYQVGKPKPISFESSATPEKATFRLIAELERYGFLSDWKMDVTYDRELNSYAYNVVTTATVTREIQPQDYPAYYWEFFDLFPQGLFDYKTGPQFYRDGRRVDFPDPLWGYIVYQRGDDIGDYFANRPTWMKVPINRYVTSASGGIRIARDGYLGVMNNPAGNPMVQLLGDTAAMTSVQQCNWFYDLHFVLDMASMKTPPPKGFSVTAQFRIVSFDTARSSEILQGALLVGYPEEERRQKRYPRYEESGINSFEQGVTIDAPDHSKIWHPFHNHVADYHPGVVRVDHNQTPENECLWVDNCGRTGTSSLRVRTTTDGIAGWQTPLFDRPIVKAGKRYRLSVYVRTENLEGPGATLGYFLGKEEKSYRFSSRPQEALKARPTFAAVRVKGTSDWTRVEVITPPMEERPVGKVLEYELRECLIQPVLWHEGKGTSWFDDFVLEECPEP